MATYPIIQCQACGGLVRFWQAVEGKGTMHMTKCGIGCPVCKKMIPIDHMTVGNGEFFALLDGKQVQVFLATIAEEFVAAYEAASAGRAVVIDSSAFPKSLRWAARLIAGQRIGGVTLVGVAMATWAILQFKSSQHHARLLQEDQQAHELMLQEKQHVHEQEQQARELAHASPLRTLDTMAQKACAAPLNARESELRGRFLQLYREIRETEQPSASAIDSLIARFNRLLHDFHSLVAVRKTAQQLETKSGVARLQSSSGTTQSRRK